MVKQIQALILLLYWRACQYPWYIFVNIGLAILFYLLALKYGNSIRTFFLEKICGLRGVDFRPTFFNSLLNLAIAYIFFSVLVILIPMPFILHKGIIFNILGYTLYYWFLFLPIQLFLSLIKNQVWVQSFKLPIVVIGLSLIVFFVVSSFYFPNQIKEIHLRFKTTKLKEKIRIVHLSDIQAEKYGSREEKLVDMVNSQHPDIVFITGDIFNTPFKYNTTGFRAAIKVLGQLETKYGIFIVGGHHDYEDVYHIVEALPDKIKLLNDEWFSFNDDDIAISAFGALLHSKKKDFMRGIEANNFRIFFAHDPILLKNLKSSDFDLVLFGHTHAGQVYIPLISSLIVGKYRHGLYKFEDMPIYVNAGVGMEGFLAPRIRWLTFPEVVIIDLIPEKP